jgi:thiol-disulfide isomerase/thioredoxin
MLKKIIPAICTLLILFSSLAMSQTVDEVVAKHVQARGGYEKWKAIKSIKVISASSSLMIKSIWKRPDRIRIEYTDMYQGETDTRAFNGTRGWRISPVTGSSQPFDMPEIDIQELKEEITWGDELIEYKENGFSLELLGKEKIDAKETIKLKLTRKSGEVMTIYLDAGTHLELFRIRKATNPMGEVVEIKSVLGDYKLAGGFLFPHLIGQMTREIEVNINIDDNLFRMPGSTAMASPGKENYTFDQLRNPATRTRVLKAHPEADVNRDGKLDIEEAWAFTKKNTARVKLLDVGTYAPDWTLKSPDGEMHSLGDYRGRIVLIDFWATWCLPCQRAMPGLQKLHEKYSGKGLVVLGVNSMEKDGDPMTMMKSKGLTYTLLIDGDAVARDYGVVGLPTLYVINTDGKIIYRNFGYTPQSEVRLFDAVEKIFEKQ